MKIRLHFFAPPLDFAGPSYKLKYNKLSLLGKK
jgi:hypothetical protein